MQKTTKCDKCGKIVGRKDFSRHKRTQTCIRFGSIPEMSSASQRAKDLVCTIERLNRDLRTAHDKLRVLVESLSSSVSQPRKRARGVPPEDLTYWKADIHARRVPNFVKKQTGLDTKRAIVERYGKNAEFKRERVLLAPLTVTQ